MQANVLGGGKFSTHLHEHLLTIARLCAKYPSVAERVCNSSGPTPAPLSPLEQLKHDLSPPVEWQIQSTKVKSGGLLHLPERIASLERYTDLYSGIYTLTFVLINYNVMTVYGDIGEE